MPLAETIKAQSIFLVSLYMRSSFRYRLRILSLLILYLGITLIVRNWFVSAGNEDILNGLESSFIAIIIVSLSAYFLFNINNLLKRHGTNFLISVKEIKDEWNILTPLNKLLAFSGLISLLTSLLAVLSWVVSIVTYLSLHV